MIKRALILSLLVTSSISVLAQRSAESAYNKFIELTKMFNGTEPYACDAIVDVKYKNKDAVRDTSNLIYKNGSTYYKSIRVERIEGSAGELVINHELQEASFNLSDSIRKVVMKELKIKPDREAESALDSNFDKKEMEVFNRYVIRNCNVQRTTKDGLEEIAFTPKKMEDAPLTSMKIRFDSKSKVRYYEYTYRDVYSTDFEGNNRFRLIRTIYDNFKYDHIPNIPSRLTDFLEWNGWTVKLKKYTNYKLSVL
ncbi:MAG TPA: hypothetical protein VL098_08530 [Flavipsychrobacter sp.]|nr:hypothetical protein [Flavipsychrobacter sp.]